MKANIKKKDPEKLYIGEVELDFNCMNENDLKRFTKAGLAVEKKYPNAMNLLIMPDGSGIDTLPANEDGMEAILKKYEDGTSAISMFFTLVFGKEKTTELLGDSPYYGKSQTVLSKLNVEMAKQSERLGLEIAKEENEFSKVVQKYAPVGAKGAPKE